MNDDPVISSIKDRQKQWMRERQIELERQSFPALSGGDLVNALTEKITSQLPKSQKNIEKAVASEKETNTCSICFELMLPKVHSPILLFPCGHTFCKQCIDHNIKSGRKVCPWCREKIASQAINHSLQNIIVAYAKENNLVVEPEKVNENYEEQLEMYNLRCSILGEEKRNNERELRSIEIQIKDEESGVGILKGEEKKVLERIEAAEKELELVRQHLRKSQIEVDRLYNEAEKKRRTIGLIEETLVPVEREKNRALAMLRIKGALN